MHLNEESKKESKTYIDKYGVVAAIKLLGLSPLVQRPLLYQRQLGKITNKESIDKWVFQKQET